MSHFKLRPRWIAASGYLLYFTAGAAFFFFSETALKELLGGFGFVLWTGMLLIGSVISFWGVVKNIDAVELIGLPGIVTSLVVYSGFLMSRVEDSPTPGILVGFAAVFAAAALGAIGRTYEVYGLVKIKSKVGRDIRDDDEGCGP